MTKSLAHCRFYKYIKKPEDFVVKEVLAERFFRKFQRSSRGVKPVSGYVLFLVKKRLMTTEQAVKRLASALNISAGDIGYAGLKDKFAVTYQYMTVREDRARKIKSLKIPGIEIMETRKTSNPIAIGDLVANEFEITLQGCSKVKPLKRIPNYFGIQRFGKEAKNHVIGKYILKRRFDKALGTINKIYRTRYNNLKEVPKQKIKFFIHAYQSYLFNKSIGRIGKGDLVAIIGYNTRLGKNDQKIKALLKKEGISTKDFQISELKLRCNGAMRNASVPVKIHVTKKGKDIVLRFTLPKGSYATTVLKEIIS